MSAFRWPVRVYYEDTDAGGVVYFANYLRFMERARTEWLRRLGLDQTTLRERDGILFVVRNVTADYRRPARLDDALEVVSGIARLSRVSMQFEQTVERDGDVLVASASDVVAVSAQNLKPARMPEHLIRTLQDAQ